MWTLFATSMKRKLKNPTIIVNYILLPLLLIVILGNALSSVFDKNEEGGAAVPASLSQMHTVVVNDDKGKLGTEIVAFLTSEDNKALFDVTVETDANKAEQMIEDGDAEQYIYIPADLTSGYESKKESNVTVYGEDSNIDKVNITSLLLSTFGDGYLAMDVSSTGNQKELYTHVYSNLLTTNGSKDGSTEGKDDSSNITALSYYGVTMLVLILVYGLANTMNFVQEEYSEALGDRYLVSPLSRTSLILGQLLTGCAISIVQGIIIVLCAQWFFDVSYGNNMMVVFFIIVAGSIFFNALGLILGVIARRVKAIDSVVTLLIPVMTFIGGGFIKIDLGGLRNMSINELYQQPLFDYIQQGVINLAPVYSSLVAALGFILISVYSLTRKGVR
ncbi:ABC-2 type transport system permease protein [Paenibacillus cellulosilyticus]|uniref:ABC-2 type transport system permease protein n=1 Tax=Paenibacillus cellulosilyticus TaxID=375489 RepID=A0A2V2YRB9_9BACL|nr:ABC transporter permease [Paenibacillus cellulosilyticus]PWV98573.1 ABC-2 type transport system permease protein [Paenibacillus cellulosilyticus]QKS44177.1 ABC transporter permease [Paenibacillus cellulosilyticus]